MLLCLALLLLVPVGAVVVYHQELAESEAHYRTVLSAMVRFKAGQVELRRRRLSNDSSAMMLYEGLIEACRRFQEAPSDSAREAILNRFAGLRKVYGYRSISLLSTNGRFLLRQGEQMDMNLPDHEQLFRAAIQNREVVNTDLYYDGTGKLRWDYIVPLFGPMPAESAVGFLVLSLDTNAELIQLMADWPLSVQQGEFILARRDVGNLLMLVPPRSANEPPMMLHLAPQDPGAGLFSNAGETVHGTDHRGVSVFGVTSPVANSNWMLLAKVDQADVSQAPLRQTYVFILLSLGFVGLLCTLLLRMWRQSSRVQVYEAEARHVADQRLLQQFFELPFIGMAIYGVEDAKWLRVNACLARMLGQAADGQTLCNLGDAISTGQQPRFQALLLEVIDGQLAEGFQGLFSLMSATNEERHVHINVRPVFNAAGKIGSLLATVEDVTARHRDESLLRQNESRLRAIFEHAGVGIGVLDSTGRWQRVNQRLCDIVDHSEAEMLQMTYVDISHPDDMRINQMALSQTWFEGKTVHGYEKRYIRQDGTFVWVEVNLSAFEEGGVSYVLAVVIDISARKNAEEELTAQKQRLQRAECIANFGNWEIDLKTRRIRASAGAAAIYGLNGGDWPLEQVRGLAFEEDRPRLEAAIDELVHHGKGFNLEFKIRRQSDGRILVLHSVAEYDIEHQTVFGVIHDITERKQFEQRLEYLALYDQLTALPNRQMFIQRLDQSLSRLRRQHGRLAVLMLDLDRFKDINDSYGHTAGDELLRQVANLLRSRLRSEDVLARLGGDEFAILIEDVSSTRGIDRVASALQEVLRGNRDLGIGAGAEIGVSIGISLYPDHAEGTVELMQHADAALNLAKAEGRNTFRYYTEALTAASRKRLSYESRLHRALANGDEFQVYYQPQWDMHTGALHGAEALIRWNDPDEGMIPPSEFIPVAEEAGLINPITDWVLDTACTFCCQNGIATQAGIRLAVNLSPRSFSDPKLAQRIFDTINRTGYPASMLELELTESALMREGASALETLNALRNTGVKLALDDFGTGYSSLAYLRRFPLDVLKIDKCFVDALNEQRSGVDIVTAIIDLAHMLGFKALAEGVENQAQAQVLIQSGCDYYQGYLGSRPLPGPSYLELVHKHRPDMQRSAHPTLAAANTGPDR
ncbi:bifunctional diguanylate cyclase/phosphodiesterase [Uliginosibacterium gangwonense]|uniref:bifunctional diguanylate cyclase/phosphodiesterase n=1 Tax=Uliginosibacterium gangwonense TaxID=392736 RepID=UPI00039EA127|nr:EAL domain-containing protein [Uliginosibacterium gangwonense]